MLNYHKWITPKKGPRTQHASPMKKILHVYLVYLRHKGLHKESSKIFIPTEAQCWWTLDRLMTVRLNQGPPLEFLDMFIGMEIHFQGLTILIHWYFFQI